MSTQTLVPPVQRASVSTPPSLRIAQFGLGPIGLSSIRLVSCKPWAKLVGGVDIDPAKVGKNLSDVVGEGVAMATGARVHKTAEELLEKSRPDVVLHTAGSKAEDTLGQIEPFIAAGVSVVSTCEELLFPSLRAPEAAARADAICKQTGARVVAAGVNPGYVMDLLPIALTGVSRTVISIHVKRVVDASTRRMPLQRKVGSGMDPAEFRRLFAAGKAGHAGFRESAALVCHAMGWTGVEITETCEPVVAEQFIKTAYFEVQAGQTRGLHQRVEAKLGGAVKLSLDLTMALGEPEPHDAVRIMGDPPIDLRVNGGIAGDDATVAALVNSVPRLMNAPAGLLLVTDLPVPRVF